MFCRGKAGNSDFGVVLSGLFGAFILAVDKGALCLVLSAFDTLPEAEFQEFVPFLSVVVNKAGLLWVVWLLPLLPCRGIHTGIGTVKGEIH